MTNSPSAAASASNPLGLPERSPGGRKAAFVAMSYVRDLTREDYDRRHDPIATPTVVPTLQRIRHVHHVLAQTLAEGRSHIEAAYLTGYSPARITQLKNDPAFQELVAHYTQKHEEVYVDVHKRIAALGVATLDELQERLEEAPDKFSIGQLMALMETAMDRTLAPNKAQGAAVQPASGGVPAIQITFVSPDPAPTIVIDGEPSA